MDEFIQKLPEFVQALTPEVMVVIFTILGALATSVIEIRKRKRLKALQTPPASDAAFLLATRALEQVEKTARDSSRKFEELGVKYDALQEKYWHQIEINTKQSQQIAKLNIELLYFRTQVEVDFLDETPIEPEDVDPLF